MNKGLLKANTLERIKSVQCRDCGQEFKAMWNKYYCGSRFDKEGCAYKRYIDLNTQNRLGRQKANEWKVELLEKFQRHTIKDFKVRYSFDVR